MEDAVHAMMMAFAVIVFVIAFTISMYMFSQITSLAETLTLYADSTLFYDNIKYDKDMERTRIVNADTIIPTLYRYANEDFCVRIYANTDESPNDPKLTQIFDLDLEGKVQSAIADTKAIGENSESQTQKANYAYKKIYNDQKKSYYLFGAPWLGNKENIKYRVDLFINGEAGYINNTYVDYTGNAFAVALENKENKFEENFVSYSWSGETMTTEEGDVLVTGNSPKDKIVITYKLITNADEKSEEENKE